MSDMKCPGMDRRFLRPQDIAEVKCPKCGRAVEFWPDDLMRACPSCGSRLAKSGNSLKCLEWCRYAARCMAATGGGDDTWVGPLREELVDRMKQAFGSDERRIEHALAVLELAEEIGREVGADPLVLVPAAILHDIGQADAGVGQFDHGKEGRHAAAGVLADLTFPAAVESEILELIEHHHDRDRMGGPNGSALFDADLIVNLQQGKEPDWESALEERALTEAGKRIGRRELAD